MYYTFLIGRSKLTSLIHHVNLKEIKHVMLTGHSEFWKQNLTMTNDITVNSNNNNSYYNRIDM
jgi:hypothetical protein